MRTLKENGAEVRLGDRVKSLQGDKQGWRLETRSGEYHADRVAANVLPQDLQTLVGGSNRKLARVAAKVRSGWGACMLYRVVRAPAGAPDSAKHLELIQDEDAPFTHGNHLFVSISGAQDLGRCPVGMRTMTVSTHVPIAEWGDLPAEEIGMRVAEVQARMRAGLAALAPEWEREVEFETSASPRTFQRFTRRSEGLVGGVPRTKGLCQYLDMFSGPVAPGLALVEDSAFPGRSTLAAALGGHRAVDRLLR